MLNVFIDGACEPINPGGTASYGLVVYRDGKRIFTKSQVIGSGAHYSNNVAEYAGLLAFLHLRKGVEPVTFHSDSQLLINQMNHIWQARRGLYLDSYREAITLCEGKPFTFVWIPREQNAEADALSLAALIKIGVKARS